MNLKKTHHFKNQSVSNLMLLSENDMNFLSPLNNNTKKKVQSNSVKNIKNKGVDSS